MTIALCLNCGETKFGALTECDTCGAIPLQDEKNSILYCVFSDWFLNGNQFEEFSKAIKAINQVCNDGELRQNTFFRYVDINHPDLIKANFPPDQQSKADELLTHLRITKEQKKFKAKSIKKESTMGDWEDFCQDNGQANDGDSDWLVDMINSENEMYGDGDEPDREVLYGEQKTAAREDHPKNIIFKNLQVAKEYAMKNPGYSFARNPDGPGFIINSTNNAIRFSKKYEEYSKRQDNIKQGKPARSHFPWRDQEIANLLKLHNSSKEIHEIAIELERSPIAISAKLRNLELITEEDHQRNFKEV